jgi:hypothetical protein
MRTLVPVEPLYLCERKSDGSAGTFCAHTEGEAVGPATRLVVPIIDHISCSDRIRFSSGYRRGCGVCK